MLHAPSLGEILEDLVLILFIRQWSARHSRRIALCGAAFEASAEDPAERVRLVGVPVRDEAVDRAHQRVEVEERCVLQESSPS